MAQISSLKPERSGNSELGSRSPLLFIGKSRRGNWIVRDQSGRRGGLFVSRAEAFRFAIFENCYHPHAVIMATGFLELDMSGLEEVAANDTMGGGPVPKSTSSGQLHRLAEGQIQAQASSGARNA